MLVNFEKLTDEQQEQFVKGFNDADDIGVNDWDSSTPWGAPWFWASPEELDGADAYEWGQAWFEKNRSEIAELIAEETGEQEKYLFQNGEDFEVLTPNEAYAKFGQRGYHGMPKFKVKAVGEQILELKGSEYEELRTCDTAKDAEILLGSWVEDDDSNVLFYESPEKAERCVREAYEDEPELAQMLDKLAKAVRKLEGKE